MLKLIFFVPEVSKENVKEALFELGLGKLGHYSHCSFETKGEGQFRPLQGSHPSIGKLGQIEKVTEYRVEMLCPDELSKRAVSTLKEVHPYEEPAFEFYPIKMI